MKIVDQNHSWPLTEIETVCITGLGFAYHFPFHNPRCMNKHLSKEFYLLYTFCITSRVISFVRYETGSGKVIYNEI
jgi:hypothetical protein